VARVTADTANREVSAEFRLVAILPSKTALQSLVHEWRV